MRCLSRMLSCRHFGSPLLPLKSSKYRFLHPSILTQKLELWKAEFQNSEYYPSSQIYTCLAPALQFLILSLKHKLIVTSIEAETDKNLSLSQFYHSRSVLHHTSSTRTRRGGSCLKDIRPFSSIELACAVRQPSPCVRALCESCVLLHMSHVKLHFALHTPHFTLHAAFFALHTSHFTLHSSHSKLHTPHFTLLTSHSTLHTPHFTLHASHFSLLSSDSTLHTSHFTRHSPHFTLLIAFFTLPTLLHSTEKLLHTASFHTQQAFTHRTLTHSAFYTWQALTHTQKLLHREAFTHSKLLHTKLLHTASFHTQQAFTHSTCTQCFYTWQAFTHRTLTHSAFTHGKRLHTHTKKITQRHF